MVKVSVIVPTYQPGDGLERVVTSLDAQTMPATDFEVLFVDDGSPDDTWERLEQVRDTHANVRLERIENSGWPSRPRNVGIDLARGEYVLFMDHDDSLYPDALRSAYAYAHEHHADVLNPKEMKTSNPGWGLGQFTADLPEARSTRRMNALLPLMPHKLYRRAFLDEHGIRFPEARRRLWEDVFFNTACYLHAEVISVLSSRPFYLWHSTEQNNSSTYGPWDAGFWDRMEELFEYVAEAFADDPDLLDAQLRHNYRVRPLAFMERYVASGDRRESWDFARERALHIIERFVPAGLDAKLPPLLQVRSALLRAGELELLAEQLGAGRLQPVSSTDGVEWRDGRLEVGVTTRWQRPDGTPVRLRRDGDRLLLDLREDVARVFGHTALDLTDAVAASSAKLTLRRREDSVTWMAAAKKQVVLEDLPDDQPDGGNRQQSTPDVSPDVTPVVRTTTRIDPSNVQLGVGLDAGVWDVRVNTSFAGAGGHHVLATSTPARPALTQGRQAVAYRNTKGNLSVDTSASLRNLLDDSRPVLDDATVRRGGRLRVRLEGAAAGRPGSSDVLARWEPVAAGSGTAGGDVLGRLRGHTEAAPATTAATLSVAQGVVRLGADVPDAPGAYRVSFVVQGTTAKSSVDVTVSRRSAGPSRLPSRATLGRLARDPRRVVAGVRRRAGALARRHRPAPGSSAAAGSTDDSARPRAAAPDASAAVAASSTRPPRAPKISVVIAAYQPGDGLDRVIGSLDAQTLPAEDLEIVIVDDGSADDTWERLLRLRDTHPNVRLERIENSGWPSRPRNVGLEMATGEYVLFMDHDDSIYPDGLRAAYAYASQHGADVLNAKELKTSNPVWGLASFTEDVPNAKPDRGFRSLLPLIPHKFYRREFLLEHGIRFVEGRRRLYEDVLFNTACFVHADVISILSSTPVYLWHATDSNNSSTYGPWQSDFWDRMDEVFAYVDETLAASGDEEGHQVQLAHNYRVRVLDKVEGYVASRDEPDGWAMALDRAHRIIDRYAPPSADDELPVLQRARSVLVRRGELDLLAAELRDRRLVPTSEADRVAWREGCLDIEATTRWRHRDGSPVRLHRVDGRLLLDLTADVARVVGTPTVDVTDAVSAATGDVTVRDRDGSVTWTVRTTTTVDLEPEDGPQAQPDVVTPVLRHVTRLDPSDASLGAALEPAIWDLRMLTALGGAGAHRALPAPSSTRTLPALSDGRYAVAYRNRSGNLSVDTSARLRNVIDEGGLTAPSPAGGRPPRSGEQLRLLLPKVAAGREGSAEVLVAWEPLGPSEGEPSRSQGWVARLTRRTPAGPESAVGALHVDGGQVVLSLPLPTGQGRYRGTLSLADRRVRTAVSVSMRRHRCTEVSVGRPG